MKIFYKKIGCIFCSAVYLLASRCLNIKQVSISSISDNTNKKEYKDEAKRDQPMLSISSCRQLASMACMKGKKRDVLFEIKGNISNPDPQADGEVAFIGLSNGTPLTVESPTVQAAIGCKDNLEKFQWQTDDNFIYWNKGNTRWVIPVSEEVYKKLTSRKYTIHMLYLQNDLPVISNTPLEMNITGQYGWLPNYQNIELEALPPIEKQINNDQGWFLKAKINPDFLADAKAGFILIKEEQAVNLYDLVQKVIALENEWPTETTSFYEMVIIPAKFRKEAPYIVSDLLSSQAPIQGGKFKLFAYLIKNGSHYYLSQMETIISNVTQNSFPQESRPPVITFTDSKHDLKVCDLKISLEKVSGQLENVKIAENSTIEYSVNEQPSELPSGLQKALLFTQKGVIWRTAILESLFEQSAKSNNNARLTEDGTICLVTDLSKPLDKSCMDFFSRAQTHEYFACLFSKEDNKLVFYTNKQEITIEEINRKQPPKLEAKPDEPSIELDNTEAYITFHKQRKWGFLKDYYAEYNLPKVKLVAPESFDKNKIIDQGFLIAKPGNLNNAKMDHYSILIENFINSKAAFDMHDNQFYILKEDLSDTDKYNLEEDLYTTYKNHKQEGYNSLDVSYWIKYENKIISSKPVSIQIR